MSLDRLKIWNILRRISNEPRRITRHWKNYFSIAVKGCIVGGTMLVPGVSGGSMAMILGIYSSLISAVSSFRQKKSRNFCFLLVFCIGAMVGMALLSNPISYLRQHRIIPGGVACQKIFCEMIQKAQAILAGLASIFGKYHGKFWRDTPPEPQGANCAVVP